MHPFKPQWVALKDEYLKDEFETAKFTWLAREASAKLHDGDLLTNSLEKKMAQLCPGRVLNTGLGFVSTGERDLRRVFDSEANTEEVTFDSQAENAVSSTGDSSATNNVTSSASDSTSLDNAVDGLNNDIQECKDILEAVGSASNAQGGDTLETVLSDDSNEGLDVMHAGSPRPGQCQIFHCHGSQRCTYHHEEATRRNRSCSKR